MTPENNKLCIHHIKVISKIAIKLYNKCQHVYTFHTVAMFCVVQTLSRKLLFDASRICNITFHAAVDLSYEYLPLFPFRTWNVTNAYSRRKHHISNIFLEEKEEAVQRSRGKCEGPQPCRVTM